MKRAAFLLTLVLCTLLVSCGGKTEMVCDTCGATFTEQGDYTEKLQDEMELREALGLRLRVITCPDCRMPDGIGPIAGCLLSPEDMERVEAYRAGKEVRGCHD